MRLAPAEPVADPMRHPEVPFHRYFLARWGLRQVFPDPGGVLGLILAVSVLVAHTVLPLAGTRGYLFSQSLAYEAAGHLWLLGGPPLALYLSLRHLLVRGTSPFPLIGAPLALFLTLLTGIGIGLAFLGGA